VVNVPYSYTKNNCECLGVILAGGLSSRMGENKSKLMRNNINMLDFSKQLLIEAGINNIVISGGVKQANNHIDDLIPHVGPVGGIYSVLSQSSANSYLILPVDLPLMTSNTLKQLRLAGELSHKATFFTDHSIPLYLPNTAYLELFMKQSFQKNRMSNRIKGMNNGKARKNGPSIKALLSQVPNQAITPKDRRTLFNTNTPQEWQQAQKILTNRVIPTSLNI